MINQVPTLVQLAQYSAREIHKSNIEPDQLYLVAHMREKLDQVMLIGSRMKKKIKANKLIKYEALVEGEQLSYIEVYLVSPVEFIDTRARFEAEGYLKDEFLAQGSQLLHLWSFYEWVAYLNKIYKNELLTEPAKGSYFFSRDLWSFQLLICVNKTIFLEHSFRIIF